MQALELNLTARCGKSSSVATAIYEVLTSVKGGVKDLTFAQIVEQMRVQVPELNSEVLLDEGSGQKYADIVTAGMDNFLELAALVSCMRSGDDTATAADRRVDVEFMLHHLTEFWRAFMRMSLVELIDPLSAAGQEQSLSMEKLKLEQMTSTMDDEDNLSDEKKTRMLAARERNAVLAAAVDVCFQALLSASRELLDLQNDLNLSCTLNADEACDLVSMIIMAFAIVTDGSNAQSISAVEAEARLPHEELRLMTLKAATSRRAQEGGKYANRNEYSFHMSTSDAPGAGYTADISPFLHCTALSGACCNNSGDGGRESMVSALLADVAALYANVADSEGKSVGEGDEERARSSLFAKLAKFEHSLTGEGSKGQDEGVSPQREEGGGGLFGRMRRHGRVRAIYGVFAQSYLITLRSPALAAHCGGTFSVSTGVMLATAAPLALRMVGEPDDQLKCLGSLLLKLLLDASPTGLVLSTQSWLLPEVYRSWETCEEITRNHRESSFKRGVLEGKVGEADDDDKQSGDEKKKGGRERRLLYLASLLAARLLHSLLCGSATSRGGMAVKHHYRYLDSLLHKVRLHVSSPTAVWCYLSQASPYLCHHHHHHPFHCSERAAAALGKDPLCEEGHNDYISARLECWSELLVPIDAASTPSAEGTDDPSSFLLSTMAGPVVETMTGLLHDCCHTAVHYHCLQWLGAVLVALAVQSRAQAQEESGGKDKDEEEEGTGQGGGSAEAQAHLVVMPELLRVLVFYHSDAQDLWLTLPDPAFQSAGANEEPERKRLRRGVVVAEVYSLLAFVLKRDQQLAQGRGMAGMDQTVRVMAAAVKGAWENPNTSQKQGPSTLLQRLPAALWQ